MISIALGGNTGGTTAFLSTGVVNLMGGNNITLNQVDQYVYIHGEDGGTGGGGTSIVPGSYLSSSLNGSTLSLSVTGLQPVGSYLSSNYTTHTHNYAATSHTHNYMGTGISTLVIKRL
jgi:hypothetical protein